MNLSTNYKLNIYIDLLTSFRMLSLSVCPALSQHTNSHIPKPYSFLKYS